MHFRTFFVEELAQSSYLIGCEKAGVCAVVDPERHVEAYLRAAAEKGMRVTHVLQTHLHADFIAGHRELAEKAGAKIALSKKAGASYDHLPLVDGDRFDLGSVRVSVLETPGHTPESVSFTISDLSRSPEPWLVFTGDTLFVGDVGRPDLFGKERARDLAGSLYDSIEGKLLKLAEGTEVYPAHGAGSLCGKGIAAKLSSTIGFEKKFNLAFAGRSRKDFVDALVAGLPPAPPYFARVSELNRLGPPVLGPAGPVPALPPAAFDAAAARPGAVVLDAREASAFGSGHVEGAISVPPGPRFSTWVGWVVPFDAAVLLVLDDDRRADEVARSLARVGYDRVGGVLAGGMSAWMQGGKPIAHLPQVSVHELRERLEGRAAPLVLDVRTDDEWRAGHVAEAVHAPLQRLGTSPPRLEPGRPTWVICGSGYRSNVTGSLLKRQGAREVSSVVGGMTAWRNAGFPVEK
ncbi:MAG TPA: MBL fold metallo-hydrolase [Planctomycetota bacterium]|jgi:glyoxylase-like metal-dependent hydrolase (beta-lactamase superfamily II)|nr:MBL fold metallo-hydrolase [Planctomycetota bacterium]